MQRRPKLVLRGLGAAMLAVGLAACGAAPQQEAAAQDGGIAIVIHGGAGTIRRGDMTPDQEREYRAKLEEALRAGYAVLEQGGKSLDAVVAAINIMEDSPLFNAGKGAVFTNEGTNELDASIMDGATLQAGAVAGVKRVRNPIDLARAVMEHSPHVMMAGAGAERFAEEQGLELVDPEYFFTERRWEALQRAQARESTADASRDDGRAVAFLMHDHKFGTVGAVALDRDGNLAAGTSTGGMTNKRWGRVGDSPVIGAGTYASNASCAVSATGHGEFFIRNVVAHDICARVEYGGQTLEEAADYVVNQKLVEQGAEGGVIALDRHGNIATPFNSEGMYRGSIDRDGNVVVQIYKEQEQP